MDLLLDFLIVEKSRMYDPELIQPAIEMSKFCLNLEFHFSKSLIKSQSLATDQFGRKNRERKNAKIKFKKLLCENMGCYEDISKIFIGPG